MSEWVGLGWSADPRVENKMGDGRYAPGRGMRATVRATGSDGRKVAARGMAFVAREMAICNRLGIPTLCVQ